MPVRIYTLAMLALLVAVPAHAQQGHLPKGRVVTMAEPLNASLKVLLDSGYVITAGAGGLGGGAFTLHNEQTGKWVSCELSGTEFGDPPASACVALN
ncbi:MAG: hypothetical protein ACRYHQ_16425 [Janthinobacterium lividum]